MKNLLSTLLVCLLWANPLAAATAAWQNGRIEDVQKTVNTKTLYWIVNTPITQDETTFTISVHMKNKIYVGSYDQSKQYGPPPAEWVKNRPVKARMDGDNLYVMSPTSGVFRLHVMKRKAALAMRPLTAEELAELDQQPSPQAPEQSLIGFDKPAEKANPPKAPAAAPPQEAPKPPEAPMGSVSVSTTPYLAEIYVDGNDMGYSPAKISLAPGKHTVRLEKPGYQSWTKEITMTAGSELTLAATLERK